MLRSAVLLVVHSRSRLVFLACGFIYIVVFLLSMGIFTGDMTLICSSLNSVRGSSSGSTVISNQRDWIGLNYSSSLSSFSSSFKDTFKNFDSSSVSLLAIMFPSTSQSFSASSSDIVSGSSAISFCLRLARLFLFPYP